ncbi:MULTISPECIES: ROK family protein [unclassified Mesorhizobium]|uniref:ROK family protein n=2 Tax=Mesorhizobium TaxID=68287 RepID=UPI000F7599D5|nr:MULTISPECIES: ROK family protein [unclassified Mesorhizobium]AZO56051.1 ROK family protein [Mesorhizobium sp. M8A.F.Ca.ET.057.01.1.1]RWE46592.1 MAG: ROK family protein [Mesorhizobium sp.]
MSIEAALAIDLGGTELRAALVDRDGKILAFAAVPTQAQAGPDVVIGQIEALAATVHAEAPALSILGVGVGAPGPLDPLAGIAVGPPTLAGWQDVPLADILERRLGLPVRLENDANAAALGEWRFGAGHGARSLVFVTVSTGIGGGVVADGHILHGRRGLAAEIGHMTITNEGERCVCGVVGCFEAIASGTALGRRANAATSPLDGSTLRRLSANAEVTGRHVVEAARLQDDLAVALLEEEARWLGVGFTNLLHLYSPDVLVVGGGIANGLDLMAPVIGATIRQRAMRAYRDVPVVQAQLGRHAGLVGAASLVLFDDGGTLTARMPAGPSTYPERRRDFNG